MYSTKRLQNLNPRGLQDCPSKRSNRFPQKTPEKRPKRPKRPQDRPKSSQCSPKPLNIILQNSWARADSTIRYCTRVLWRGHNQRLLMCSTAGMGFPTQTHPYMTSGPRRPGPVWRKSRTAAWLASLGLAWLGLPFSCPFKSIFSLQLAWLERLSSTARIHIFVGFMG